MRKKSDLPSKICPVCERPFVWRKKWQRCWDEVRFCSVKCKALRGKSVLSN
ncbi:DUF2256 domain-containing protein [Porticoccaceae bacterium]|nr:DUF2256 domain-containing protein [Porticoccaceae bacterium]MDB4260107.1 DUF2256 domain-containing protein [Porticoccaceae bacterium]MDB9706461.1 DUF2256 domain-containing protein [Porticoccaceae bacterium]MDC0011447.1 DUF2256 domain-containing protein [Porticoccaceae bacterium]